MLRLDMTRHHREEGVYFRPEDYAGLSRRMGIATFDAVVVAFYAAVPLGVASAVLSQKVAFYQPAAFLALSVSAFCYLVLLKRTRFGTFGYQLGGVRIVDYQGKPPSLFALTIRMLFAGLGLANLLMDLLLRA